MTVAEYARQHGMTWNRAKRAMFPRARTRWLATDRIERIHTLLAEGWKQDAIAAEVGCCKSTVSRRKLAVVRQND